MTTIELYEQLETVTGQMLTAARAEDWNTLTQLEAVCAKYSNQIVLQSRHEKLTGEDLSRKISSLSKILADDRQIRDLVQPWMKNLTALLEGQMPDTGLNLQRRTSDPLS